MVYIIDEEETSSLCENESQPDALKISSPEVDTTEDPDPTSAQYKRGQAAFNKLLEINLGTKDEPRPTFINGNIS